MANITTPEIVNFLSEVIRPLSEALVTLDLNSQLASTRFDLVQTHPDWVAALATDVVFDGRPELPAILKSDAEQFMAIIAGLLTQMGTGTVRTRMRKPNVRVLRKTI